MNNQKDILAVFRFVLEPLDFMNRKESWYRSLPEISQVVNLQKSDFGGQFYINIGVSPLELITTPYPLENKYHLRLRAERILLKECVVQKTLDLEDESMNGIEREESLRKVLLECVGFLDRVDTKAKLRAAIIADNSLLNRSSIKLKQLLDIPI
jgi:hypothetical protein